MIHKLGGAPFLATIARCHRAYGEVLNITGSRDGNEAHDPDAPVRRSLDATHMALREYVANVAAVVRRTDNDTICTATVLLQPLSARASQDEYESVDEHEVTFSSVER